MSAVQENTGHQPPENETDDEALLESIRLVLCTLHGMKWHIDSEISKITQLQNRINKRKG